MFAESRQGAIVGHGTANTTFVELEFHDFARDTAFLMAAVGVMADALNANCTHASKGDRSLDSAAAWLEADCVAHGNPETLELVNTAGVGYRARRSLPGGFWSQWGRHGAQQHSRYLSLAGWPCVAFASW